MATIVETVASNDSVGREQEQIPAEILAVITAAATAFLGNKLRIGKVEFERSKRDSVSKWTQQGRASVQASHNLRSNK
jgi:hypothetical protein